MAIADLLARDAIELASESRAILGIAGSPGAGKSTLVDGLLDDPHWGPARRAMADRVIVNGTAGWGLG